MSNFKDMVASDNAAIFMNADEFAEKRTVIYDGTTYTDIPILLTKLKEKDRRLLVTDHNIQGLYLVAAVLHCKLDDIGGVLPEKHQYIKINDEEGVGGFFYKYRIVSSGCTMGMLRAELEAIDE